MPGNPFKALLLAALIVAIAAALSWAGAQGGATWNGWPLIAWYTAFAFVFNWLVFIPSYIARTEHYFDLTGSITFMALAVFGLVMNADGDLRTTVICSLILIWAIRLGSFLFARVKNDGKDARFDELKQNFFKFFNVWTLQGLWVFLTLAAALAAISSAQAVPFGWVGGVGVAVWLFGFGVEALADYQKRVWRRDPVNKGGFISSGLWSWSQHPNYFGEITLWLGISIIALPVLSGWQYACLISPVFVWLLLTKISGIPLLDEQAQTRFEGNEAYWDYTRRTSKLILRPPRSA